MNALPGVHSWDRAQNKALQHEHAYDQRALVQHHASQIDEDKMYASEIETPPCASLSERIHVLYHTLTHELVHVCTYAHVHTST
jgi:hypothetical protein